MQAYKYLSSDYMQCLLDGKIYLNTLGKIRNMDQGKIGDPEEGIVRNKSGLLHLEKDALNRLQHVQNISQCGINLEGSTGTFSNCSFTGTLDDAHIYCVTRQRNDDYWWKEEKYDCCVKIKDYEVFCVRIIAALRFTHSRFEVADCFYDLNIGNVAEGNFKSPSYFRKTPKHQVQNETRLVLLPSAQREIRPFKVPIKVDDLIVVVNAP